MKKITIVLIVLFISTFAFGQEKGTHDFGINVGFFSSNEFLNTTEDIIQSGTFENTVVTPSIAINYKIAIKKNWFFYADGVYQGITEDVMENNIQVGDVSHRYLTFGFGTEYHYIVKEWFQMYSGASIAYTSRSSKFTTSSSIFEDANEGFFNFQVNAVGFRVGKALAATLELGVGYKGSANLGISYQF
ncbi:MAG: hypothetical protein KAH25_02150 [Bacteroidales bacterium]|nr:hypothetical protein [Bacteroidales bacterium]